MISRAFATALSVALLSGAAHAADIAPSYATPGYPGRIGGVVTLCPSTDGSKTAVVCSSGGGGAVTTTPGTRTLVPLDVSTVTTGGTAVTALTAGHRTAGGWIYNPATATVPLCINEVATASGTTSQGSLTCIPPDRTEQLAPSAAAVSVVSSDSAHPFSGYGFQ